MKECNHFHIFTTSVNRSKQNVAVERGQHSTKSPDSLAGTRGFTSLTAPTLEAAETGDL